VTAGRAVILADGGTGAAGGALACWAGKHLGTVNARTIRC